MGSVAMIYIPTFMKTGSGIQVIRERIQPDSLDGDRISTL
jgi:hypothetical protein